MIGGAVGRRSASFVTRMTFVILVEGTRDEALAERDALAPFRREELRLELSKEKTVVTAVEDGFDFLGYRVVQTMAARTGRQVGNLYIPKQKMQRLRDNIKARTSISGSHRTLAQLIEELNSIIRGWRTYYRYATLACREFHRHDGWLSERVYRWLRKKHRGAHWRVLQRRFRTRTPGEHMPAWREGTMRLGRFSDGGTTHYRRRGSMIDTAWTRSSNDMRSSDAMACWRALNSLTSLDLPTA